jgi:hypothetical protein
VNRHIFGLIQLTQKSGCHTFDRQRWRLHSKQSNCFAAEEISSLVDTLTEDSGAAESTILHLSGSQATQCFDSDSRHILPICTAHGARDRPILDSIPLEEGEGSMT